MMRTAWVAPGQGSSLKLVYLFCIQHGTLSQAQEAAREVLANHDDFQARAESNTGLALWAEPAMLVTSHDVERALECLRRREVA